MQEALDAVQQGEAPEQVSGSSCGGLGPVFGVLPVKEAALELDLNEEVMDSLLSYLQVGIRQCHIASPILLVGTVVNTENFTKLCWRLIILYH